MTIHYHGTPITPRATLLELTGRNFCVPFSDPRDIEICHQIGQSVMIDNGAYSLWRKDGQQKRNWNDYYDFVSSWLHYQSTWCVIPDVIDGSEEENDALLDEWDNCVGTEHWNVAPVWHIHESFERLSELVTRYTKVCFGSSGRYAVIGTPQWNGRMNETFNFLSQKFTRIPAWIHMLRGMSLAGSAYPFASVDSTDIAQNHHLRGAIKMAERWDAQNCPGKWVEKPIQEELVLE